MSPTRRNLRLADRSYARARRDIARAYLEAADLLDDEAGLAINVCVALCVLAGIAASDTIAVIASERHYSGSNHAEAADYLESIDAHSGRHLRKLIALKSASHYGTRLLTANDRTSALRDARALVAEANRRVT
jgi:hypothetical protein